MDKERESKARKLRRTATEGTRRKEGGGEEKWDWVRCRENHKGFSKKKKNTYQKREP
jgi:hypothetical protein